MAVRWLVVSVGLAAISWAAVAADAQGAGRTLMIISASGWTLLTAFRGYEVFRGRSRRQ
ncbi:MAG: hypothetical protein ABR598_09355 [Candidatus Dormibacteria bacterium]